MLAPTGWRSDDRRYNEGLDEQCSPLRETGERIATACGLAMTTGERIATACGLAMTGDAEFVRQDGGRYFFYRITGTRRNPYV